MIRTLTLTNFKGFRDATIPFGPLTLLVGTNASGKSNVREALQFLHGCSQDLGHLFASGWLEDAVECLSGADEVPRTVPVSES